MVLIAVLAGCGGRDRSDPSVSPKGSDRPMTFSGSHPIEVVTTTGMVADIVRVVASDQANVTQLCGSGVDPHLYKPSRDDNRKIMKADMIFYSGLHLEGRMGDSLNAVKDFQPVIAVTESIDPAMLVTPAESPDHPDPHVWNDVSAWSQCVSVVADALAEFDPPGAESYHANAKTYQSKLAELHQYGIDAISTIPEQRRILITSHDAFHYFGRAYGLEVMGIQGLSTQSEAGIQRINELVDLLVEKKIAAVFVETSVSPKNMEALIEGAKSRGHDVRIGGELFSDAMGSEGTYEGSYYGMLDHNLTIVAKALGGNVDPQGHLGKLTVDQ